MSTGRKPPAAPHHAALRWAAAPRRHTLCHALLHDAHRTAPPHTVPQCNTTHRVAARHAPHHTMHRATSPHTAHHATPCHAQPPTSLRLRRASISTDKSPPSLLLFLFLYSRF